MKPSKLDEKGMRYPALNDLISKAHNKYELVIATAKRAREIVDGAPPLVKVRIDNPISIATEEIADDLIHLDNPSYDQQEDLTEYSINPQINTLEFAQTDVNTVAEDEDEAIKDDILSNVFDDNHDETV